MIRDYENEIEYSENGIVKTKTDTRKDYIKERIKNIDELIHIYEFNWYMSTTLTQDRYDLGALERLRNEKNFLLDLLQEIK